MPKPTGKARLPSQNLVPILGDAALAGPIADGRLIPVLILDTRDHPNFAELIRVHEHVGPGDVSFQWAQRQRSKDQVILVLDFSRPIEIQVLLPFSIEKQGILVDLMLESKAVYLQAGAPGDRLVTTMESPRILVELPDTGFQQAWEELYLKRMTEVIRHRAGIPRAEARSSANEFINQMRDMGRFRMRQ